MTTLPEFLLARLAEDETVAKAAQEDAWSEKAGIHGFEDPWPSHFAFAEHLTPARVLAKCEADRRIVRECHPVDWRLLEGARPEIIACYRVVDARQLAILAALATIYADHPDYREEWKP